MEFRITQTENNSKMVDLSGPINEDAELTLKGILDELTDSAKVTFNFTESTSINSLGVRAWVQFLRSASEGRTVSFENCTPDIISQINLIPSFLGKSTVTSFFTNYICEDCNRTEKIHILTDAIQPKQMPDKAKCPSCGKEMETEELEDEYFAFLMK